MTAEVRNKNRQLAIDHGEEQELKQETTAVRACYVPVCLKKKHNACKAVWFTKATVHWSNFCIFVGSIDSTNHPTDDPSVKNECCLCH